MVRLVRLAICRLRIVTYLGMEAMKQFFPRSHPIAYIEREADTKKNSLREIRLWNWDTMRDIWTRRCRNENIWWWLSSYFPIRLWLLPAGRIHNGKGGSTKRHVAKSFLIPAGRRGHKRKGGSSKRHVAKCEWDVENVLPNT